MAWRYEFREHSSCIQDSLGRSRAVTRKTLLFSSLRTEILLDTHTQKKDDPKLQVLGASERAESWHSAGAELTGPDRWRRCLQAWSSLPPRSTHGIDKPRSSCQLLRAPCTHGRSRAGFAGPVLQFHHKSHPHRRRGYEEDEQQRPPHDHCAAAETKWTQGSPSTRKLWWPSAWTHCCCDGCYHHLTRSWVQNASACGYLVIPPHRRV